MSSARLHKQHADIVLVGGGSGGHITPLIAVAASIKKQQPDARVAIIGQKGEDLADVLSTGDVDAVYEISAGKFRRYHGESVLSHLLDVKTMALNIRDLFRFIRGTFQARRLLKKVSPGAIMLKGGFVSVPVGFAARWLSIPYITHDSDAIPGLANRLTARHAQYNTTALPSENYPYPQEKSRMVGIPLRDEFVAVNATVKNAYRKELGIPLKSPVIFCTGGGNGAQSLNKDVATVVSGLVAAHPGLHVLHVAGKKHQHDTDAMYVELVDDSMYKRVQVFGFYDDLHMLSGAADVVVTRGGATNIAEFATQRKATVVVPSPILTGGQQLHNAEVLRHSDAAMVVDEGDVDGLQSAVDMLLSDKKKNEHYSIKIGQLSVDDAAGELARILLQMLHKGQ